MNVIKRTAIFYKIGYKYKVNDVEFEVTKDNQTNHPHPVGHSSEDLRQRNYSGSDLRNADLSSADLRGADLRWANLSSADLSGAFYNSKTEGLDEEQKSNMILKEDSVSEEDNEI